MRNVIFATLLGLTLAVTAHATAAQELRIGANDSVQSVLAAQKGKRVTVRVRSGQEFTGIMREATGRLVQLGAISGREFFDAVVPLDAIDAVLVRTRE
jgi:Skp family chaperone for outer membrane proteins